MHKKADMQTWIILILTLVMGLLMWAIWNSIKKGGIFK
jgi:hypothetical protein